ncbi:MAG TPA: hypothetical protein VG013_42560 [Gemmataceae bacterium]|jgi:hypothetical protein|nr:hypothetical protein [Gemmataceae bacterium]
MFAAVPQGPITPEVYIGLFLLSFGLGLMVWSFRSAKGEHGLAKVLGTTATILGAGLLFLHIHEQIGLSYEDLVIPPVALGLFIWGIASPEAGRRFAKVFAVLALAAGTALLLVGILTMVKEQVQTIEDHEFPSPLREPTWVLAMGAGLLAGGVLALVLSFIGVSKRPRAKDGESQEPAVEDVKRPFPHS